MTCSYCGHVFDIQASRHECAGCVAGAGCRSVRCPRCTYEMPEELQLVSRLRAWFQRRRTQTAAAAIPDQPRLTDLSPGQRGTVLRLEVGDAGQRHKLMALGVLPGTAIELERRSPAFVFRVGFSRFAVDERMASAVIVEVTP
jgi:Fe2+ transport system protein FeoA